MRRIVLLAVVLGFVAAAPVAAGEDGDAILGLWATDPEGAGGEAHVEIFMDGNQYTGTIVWLAEPVYPDDDEQGMAGKEKIDRENPDPDLRERPVIGLQMLEGFRYDGKGTWHKGTIYDPDNGKTYKSKLRLSGEGVLKVRGFVGFSFIGRTTTWTRVEDGE
ncbi:MAG: DUF2147 domain-containing protein [Thermoanaerobaculales bacterium]